MTHLALGMAAIGRPQYINIKTTDSPKDLTKEAFHAQAINVLQAAYEMNIRHIDTAPGYGIAEEMLLDWIRSYKPSGISISTKWGYTYTANFEKDPAQHEHKEHSLHMLQTQWNNSKELLPYMNIYQIHSATPDSGVLDNSEILEELFRLKETYALEIGITTSGCTQNETIRKALAVKKDNKPLFTVFQVTYNVFEQSVAESIDSIKNRGAAIIVKEGLANGRIFNASTLAHYKDAYSILKKLAEKYNVGIDAIALRFCIDAVQPLYVLSGASTINQLKENLLAETFILDSEDMLLLQSIRIESSVYWNERKQLEWN